MNPSIPDSTGAGPARPGIRHGGSAQLCAALAAATEGQTVAHRDELADMAPALDLLLTLLAGGCRPTCDVREYRNPDVQKLLRHLETAIQFRMASVTRLPFPNIASNACMS